LLNGGSQKQQKQHVLEAPPAKKGAMISEFNHQMERRASAIRNGTIIAGEKAKGGMGGYALFDGFALFAILRGLWSDGWGQG
jgi:hypothetical protein